MKTKTALRRMIAAILAVIMMVGVLAGCGGPAEQNAPVAPAATEKTPEKAPEAAEEPVTVTWYAYVDVMSEDQEMVMEELNKYLVEELGIKMDLQISLGSEYDQKVQLALSSGEPVDIMFTCNWINDYHTNLANGNLMAIDDLYAQYGQDIAKELGDTIEFGKAGGKLYAIPNTQILTWQRCVSIQKDLWEKYGNGITHAESLRDFEPFFQAIVENEPDYIPYAKNPDTIEGIAMSHEQIGTYGWLEFEGDEMYLDFDHIKQATFEDAKMYHEWWKKGYLRSDVATFTTAVADGKAGKNASGDNRYMPTTADAVYAYTGIEHVVIPIGQAYLCNSGVQSTMTAISATSEHPVEAMKLINFIYTDKKAANMLMYGLEGVHYNLQDDGLHMDLVEDSGYIQAHLGWMMGSQFNAYLTEGQADDVWEQTKALNESADLSKLAGFQLDTSELDTYMAQMANVVAEYDNVEFMVDSVEELEKVWDEYYDKMEQAGLKIFIDEVNSQIEAWQASK